MAPFWKLWLLAAFVATGGVALSFGIDVVWIYFASLAVAMLLLAWAAKVADRD